MNRLNLSNLRGDFFGGLTAAVVALPLAIAFGVASGAGPVAGLYGAICVGFFAALFGGTPSQISGPTGPMTIVAATVFTQFGERPAMAFTVVMLAGAMQILFGYLKIGRYINLMPYPVVSGFMTGIGCILIIMQIEPLVGYASPQSVVNALTVLPAQVLNPNLHALIIGLIAFAICTRLPKRIGRVIPPPLVALVVGSLLALSLTDAPVLGSIPSGLPSPRLPQFDFADLNRMLVAAAVLAALGSIDSLLTSLVADNVTRTFHDSDRELVGQGIGNLVAGLAGGIPGAGATIRTLTNVNAGGRTPLSGVIHAVALFAIVLGLGPAVAYVPHAALAGVLLKVGIDVIDWRFLRRIHRLPRVDLVLMLVVLVLSVFVDVVTAVAVGVVLASLTFVKRTADIQIESIRAIADPEHARLFTPEESTLFRRCGGRALVLHLSGLISFGAAIEMTRKISAVGQHDVLIIDLVDVPEIDGSAALALEEIIQRAEASGQRVFMVGLSLPVARLLGRIGVLDVIKETSRFHTRAEAIAAALDALGATERGGNADMA
ncbi:MAG: SulP family inorganic anion transporter [Gammaproteobacteria bacterium]|nr:SulP family inorganic anion transporter [Gammaproteobacteria bacterium]MDH4255476.1 SulP family inorganic anion transporter [Gammaproteobacteria bacterium]MDH5309509.1 SulP family inorganic anion transporter [Gammaproteobacteria bacterium]